MNNPVQCSLHKREATTQSMFAEADAFDSDTDTLKRAWQHYSSDRSREGVYRFLDPVYEVGIRWTKASPRGRRYLKLAKTDMFSVLIAAASDDGVDRKTRSKWSRALRYAQRRMKGTKLSVFVRKRGGINACASKHARFSRIGKDATGKT